MSIVSLVSWITDAYPISSIRNHACGPTAKPTVTSNQEVNSIAWRKSWISALNSRSTFVQSVELIACETETCRANWRQWSVARREMTFNLLLIRCSACPFTYFFIWLSFKFLDSSNIRVDETRFFYKGLVSILQILWGEGCICTSV